MKILVKILRDDIDFGLNLTVLAGSSGLQREITHPRVQKPGLALAGHLDSVRESCVQVLGQTEIRYLDSLDGTQKRQSLRALCATHLACIVVTCDLEPPAVLFELAEEYGVTVLRGPLDSDTLMNRLHNCLDEHLSPEITVHGVVLDIFGLGVMIIGDSGIGKSECALDLVLRGHRLVADDAVVLKQRVRELLATSSPLTRHHMEVRGLGIINVKDLFGAAAVRETKRLELLVELSEWRSDMEYDRMGIDELQEEIFDIPIAKIRLPIRPGRNVASIVEVAARNHLLKLQGHHSALKFQASLEGRLTEQQDGDRWDAVSGQPVTGREDAS